MGAGEREARAHEEPPVRHPLPAGWEAQTVTAEAFLGGLAVLDPDRFVLQKRVVCSKRGTAPASQYVAFGGGVEAGNIK